MDSIRHKIQLLPKGDVHSHLHLSARLDLLKAQYPHLDLPLPQYYDGFMGMMEFINQHIKPFMSSSEKAIALMDLGIRSSIADRVTRLEASVDLNLIRLFGNSIKEFIEAVEGLKQKYVGVIDFRPEIGINKDSSIDLINGLARCCFESGVFYGLDIYGNEKGRDLSGFRQLFLNAKYKNLKTKVHIGEFGGPETIEEAIMHLEPDEIQHGIHAVKSAKTIQMILERGIRLNICPQSNIALGAVADLHTHPIRKLYDAGINLTINTDDLLLFNASLTDQYISLMEQGVFSFNEIDGIRLNSLQ
ncbi:amidohydrolase family protein [Arenibacter amylolyticus]|uniref:hypothetical protein n=1 Tax=Arenibacter amylolyticus TaxID=1406873 RepID=UPI000A37AC60|nr:hypothetical protein [Arenibacter amylolyticus]